MVSSEVYALQVQVKFKRKLELLRQRNELEEAEVLAEITAAEKKLKKAQMIEALHESIQQRPETTKQVSSKPIANLRAS